MKKIFSVLKQVTFFLAKYPPLRDNDERLMANIWWKFLGESEIDNMSARDILKRLAKGDLPSYESISRCRRKIQETTPMLRGATWEARHKRQKSVKNELRQLTGARKKIKKPELKRKAKQRRQTPYPVNFEYSKRRYSS